MKKEIDLLEARVQPHDTNTELAVLSSLMMYNENFAKYGDLLDESLFYYEREKAIFRCIEGVVNSGSITDINSLTNWAGSHDVGSELLRTDFAALLKNLNKVTIGQDIERLRDMSRRRTSWRLLQEAAQGVLDMTNNMDDVLNGTMSMLADAQNDAKTGIISNDEALSGVMRQVESNRCDKGSSMRTGFKLFDERYLLRPGTLTVIAAFTSVGKSALALNIVEALAKQGIPSAYYSLEMNCRELASRLISKDAGVTTSAIMNRSLTDAQVQKVQEAISKNSQLPIYYDDKSTADFNRTVRSIRKMAKTKGIRLAVIDYLQIYAQVSDDMEHSISYMARTCKNIAKELDICIVLISQLNRSALHPSIKMLRGSGQIEESADNVVLIDRPEAYPDNKVTKYEGEYKDVSIKGTAKLILSKGRGVGVGSSLIGFNGTEVRFYEMSPVNAERYVEHKEDLPF